MLKKSLDKYFTKYENLGLSEVHEAVIRIRKIIYALICYRQQNKKFSKFICCSDWVLRFPERGSNSHEDYF